MACPFHEWADYSQKRACNRGAAWQASQLLWSSDRWPVSREFDWRRWPRGPFLLKNEQTRRSCDLWCAVKNWIAKVVTDSRFEIVWLCLWRWICQICKIGTSYRCWEWNLLFDCAVRLLATRIVKNYQFLIVFTDNEVSFVELSGLEEFLFLWPLVKVAFTNLIVVDQHIRLVVKLAIDNFAIDFLFHHLKKTDSALLLFCYLKL